MVLNKTWSGSVSIGISRNIIWGLSLLSVLFSVACNDPDITVESIILGKKIRNVESYSISEQKGYRSTLKRDSVKFLGCYGVLDLTVDSFYRCYHIYWLATHLDSNLWLTMGDKIRAVVVKDYGSPSFDTLEPLSRHRVGGRPEV